MANAQVANLPDLQQLLKDQQAMVSAVTTIQSSVTQAISDKHDYEQDKADQAKTEFLNGLTPEAFAQYSQMNAIDQQTYLMEHSPTYNTAFNEAALWGTGGDYKRAADAVTAIITGVGSGQAGGQVATNALAPYAAQLIGNAFDSNHGNNPNQAAQILSHAVLGAVLAYANGGNAATGAMVGGGSEAAAQYLIRELYPQAIDENGVFHRDVLNETQAQNIVALTNAIGAVVGGMGSGLNGGTTTDVLANAAIDANVAKNVVENNELHPSKYGDIQKALGSACFVNGDFTWTEACKNKITELQTASKSNSSYWKDTNDAQVQAFTENVRSDIEKLRGYCNGNADCNRLVDLQKVSIPLMALGSYEEAQNYVYSFQLALQTANGNYGQMALQFIGDFGFVPAPSIVNSGVKFVLVNKLNQSGVKFNKEALVAIRELPDGRVIFLEQGTSTIVNGVEKGSGLAHIMKHVEQFTAKDIATKDIPKLLMDAVNNGKIVGTSGKSTPVFEVVYNGQTRHVAIGVGSNGYIVQAYPVSSWGALK